jgi:hypothetical protein
MSTHLVELRLRRPFGTLPLKSLFCRYLQRKYVEKESKAENLSN